MPGSAPLYDLVLLLSNAVPDERRTKIMADVESAISSGGGSVERNDDWGARNLAYQINHQPDAEYHLLQFSGPAELLESLSHSLKISDGVLRFRIIKVLPGTPAPPDLRPAPSSAPASQPAAAHPAAPPDTDSQAEAASEGEMGSEPEAASPSETSSEPSPAAEPGPGASGAEPEPSPEPAEA